MLLCRPPFNEQKSLPPTSDQVTLCEIDGEILHISSNTDPNLNKFVQNGGIFYPLIKIPIDLPINNKDINADKDNKEYEDKKTLIKRQSEKLLELRNSNNPYTQKIFDVIDIVTGLSSLFSDFLLGGGIGSLTKRIYNPSIFKRSLPFYDKSINGPIKCCSWHPYRQVIAIAHSQDSIFLFDVDADIWYPAPPRGLFHKLQNDIRCLEWNPTSPTILAVGCSTGILIYKLLLPKVERNGNEQEDYDYDINNNNVNNKKITLLNEKEEPTIKLIKHFKSINIQDNNIEIMRFSPDGTLLITGSRTTSALNVWNYITGENIRIFRTGGGTFTKNICFSPNGKYLLQSCGLDCLRIWDTKDWKIIETLKTTGTCNSLQWFNDSKMFMFSIIGENRIFIRTIESMIKPKETIRTQRIGDIYLPAYKIESNAKDSEGGNEEIVVGGTIKSFAMDPKCQRLVVIFDNSYELKEWTKHKIIKEKKDQKNKGDSLMSVFNITMQPLPFVRPLGFIKGPQDSFPQRVQFVNKCEKGAVLSTIFDNAQVSLHGLWW